MFDALPASSATPAPRSRVAAAAVLLHGLGVVVAVNSTAAPPDARPITRDTIRLHVSAPVPPTPPDPGAPPIPPPPISLRPAVPDPGLSLPEIEGIVPKLSPVDLTGLARSPQSPAFAPASDGTPAAGRRLFDLTAVDQVPALKEELHPRYPDSLRRAGVQGWVEVEYVVNHRGRVEGHSVRVLAGSHPAFVLSALEAIRGARFRPAQRGSHPVAVLVRQTIRFRIH
ncbi:MAG TPA: TonB family protein [Gemmatimonadales bacterium]